MPSLTELLIEFLAFCAVFAGAMVLERSLGGYLAVRRRLGQEAATHVVARSPVLKSNSVDNRFLTWVQSVTAPKGSKEAGQLRRDLAFAGFDHPSAPIWYVIIRFSLAIGLPVLLISGLALIGHPLKGLGGIIFPLVVCGIGLIAPRSFIDRRAGDRRARMEQEFPDALDLMVVCVEAGLGLESAFVRVAQETSESHPRVSEEFSQLAVELSAGRSRADALRAMAERVGVDSVNSFVALLIQTDALGVSIAQGLRTYSGEMRESRFLKAEEKAMRIPVLMTMPIVACFMPVIVVALLLPPVIDVIHNFKPAMMTGSASAPPSQGGH